MSNNRAALALLPSNSVPLPHHGPVLNSCSGHGTVIAATPSYRSSVGSVGSQPSVTAVGLPSRDAGGLLPNSRLSAGSVAAVQPDGPAAEPSLPSAADRRAHIVGSSQAAGHASGQEQAAAAAATIVSRHTELTAAMASASQLPHTQVRGPEEPHRSAGVQPPMPLPLAASLVLGGAAAPGAAATMLGEDSPLDAASELFAALASASEFACLADAELSQQ